jgi:hypothetical protein
MQKLIYLNTPVKFIKRHIMLPGRRIAVGTPLGKKQRTGAWSVVKKKYKKDNGRWVKKE